MSDYPSNKEDLDREYSPSHKIDDIGIYISTYADQSIQTRKAFSDRAKVALAYGPDPRHTLDFFPAQDSGAPLFVFVHGGFWQELDPSYFSYPATAFAAQNINYASLGYRLAPQASLSQIVDDVRLGLTWLRNRSDQFGFDPHRLVIGGHSAGAHLCAMMMTSEWETPPFAGAMLISGVYDLEPVRLSYVNNEVDMDKAEAAANSPALITPAAHCPTVITYGENDTGEFHRQSNVLYDAWRQAVPDCRLLERPDRHHFDIVLELGEPDAPLFQKSMSLLSA